MTFTKVEEWFSFLQGAPEGIREYLLGTFWILVFLLLVWAILKIIFNKEFKKLYKVLGSGARTVSYASKNAAKGAVNSLDLPEPYPRLTRFFAIVFMLNNYAAFFIFVSFFMIFSILFVTSDGPNFFQRIGGMLFIVVIGYFAWFLFAQAEQDRIKLFKNKGGENS